MKKIEFKEKSKLILFSIIKKKTILVNSKLIHKKNNANKRSSNKKIFQALCFESLRGYLLPINEMKSL